MGSDHQKWNQEPPARSSNAAPKSVSDIYRRDELRRGLFRLIFWSVLLIGLCSLAIWFVLSF
jgi:hypothetical protein